MANLEVDEARLLAIYRAIKRYSAKDKYGLITTGDTSAIEGYTTGLLDMEERERDLSADQLESFLDGVIAGFVVNRLIHAEISLEDLQQSAASAPSDYVEQTGVDTQGEIRK